MFPAEFEAILLTAVNHWKCGMKDLLALNIFHLYIIEAVHYWTFGFIRKDLLALNIFYSIYFDLCKVFRDMFFLMVGFLFAANFVTKELRSGFRLASDC